ncbi:MAG: hypothetical protein KY455_05735 [Euryarchaeota archaeon]|nr:hypothetical protein [Euryarchaeota archaeon]
MRWILLGVAVTCLAVSVPGNAAVSVSHDFPFLVELGEHVKLNGKVTCDYDYKLNKVTVDVYTPTGAFLSDVGFDMIYEDCGFDSHSFSISGIIDADRLRPDTDYVFRVFVTITHKQNYNMATPESDVAFRTAPVVTAEPPVETAEQKEASGSSLFGFFVLGIAVLTFGSRRCIRRG